MFFILEIYSGLSSETFLPSIVSICVEIITFIPVVCNTIPTLQVIKLWDLRKEDPILMIQPEHSNFISSFSVDSTGSTLLAASGDGRLSVWNSRQRKLIARSDECDSELLTCNVVRANSKVVCGDGEGVLNIFTWDDWGDISDRVPVQEEVSIDYWHPKKV